MYNIWEGEAVKAQSVQRCQAVWRLERIQKRAADMIKGLENSTSRQERRRVDYLQDQRWRGYKEEFPGTNSSHTVRNSGGETPAELPDNYMGSRELVEFSPTW